MANDFVIQPGERVLKEDSHVVWLKSWIARVQGRLIFTTQRLVLALDKRPALSLGQAVQNEMTNQAPIDIPRDALEAIEQGKTRRTTNVLVVKTENEKFTLLLSQPFKDWEATLRQAMHDDKVALEHVLEKLKPKDNPPPYR
jgi:hypothetical protein